MNSFLLNSCFISFLFIIALTLRRSLQDLALYPGNTKMIQHKRFIAVLRYV